jgi:hypothetical protein
MSKGELLRVLVRLDQGQEFLYRTLLTQNKQRVKLEQEKLNKRCPGLFVLERTSHSPINLHDWVSRGYCMQLLCQYPQGPHTMADKEGYEVRQGKEWWNMMSPWLRRIVKVLEVGIPLGKTINEGFKLVDIERFAPEIEVLNEILGDLPEISTIDALSESQIDEKKVQVIQHLEGAALEALHTFLQGHPRPWQGLSQVITDDGTILWLCEHHRKEFESLPIPVI